MHLSTKGILVGLAVALPYAWQRGGTVGTGIATGFLLGASLVLAAAAYQSHLMRLRPEKVMLAHLSFSLIKLGGLAVCWLALDGIEASARLFRGGVEWRSFLTAYAAAILIGTMLAAFDVARSIKSTTKPGWKHA